MSEDGHNKAAPRDASGGWSAPTVSGA